MSPLLALGRQTSPDEQGIRADVGARVVQLSGVDVVQEVEAALDLHVGVEELGVTGTHRQAWDLFGPGELVAFL